MPLPDDMRPLQSSFFLRLGSRVRRTAQQVPFAKYHDSMPPAWSSYADGFKIAGDLGADAILRQQVQHEAEFLVYAVMFCYRHCLEVALKDLLHACDVTKKREHSLSKLLDVARPELDRFFPDFSHTDEYSLIRERLTELDSVDKEAQGFRYPIDTSGHSTLKGVNGMNLELAKDMVQVLYTSIQSMSTAVYEVRRQEP